MLVSKNFGDVVAFSRTSAGWSFSRAGVLAPSVAGAPRFDYDPLTQEAKGVLLEDARANLCTYSEFPNGVSDAPARGGAVSAAALSWLGYFTTGLAIGWDGTNSAYAYKAVTFSAATQYTASVLVRMDDGNAPSFGSASGADPSNDFAMVVANATIAPNGLAVQALGGGIYRLSGTLTTSASPGQNIGVVKYATNSSRTFKVTGYQVASGADSGSYIPTTSASVTRAADTAAIADLAKIAFNPREGAIYADFVVPRLTGGAGIDPAPGVFGLVGAYPNNLFGVGVTPGGKVQLYRTISGVSSTNLVTANTLAPGSMARVGVAWSAAKGDALCLNGGPVVTAVGSNLIGMTELRLGRFASNPGYLNGWLRGVTIAATRPDDGVLQAKTAL